MSEVIALAVLVAWVVDSWFTRRLVRQLCAAAIMRSPAPLQAEEKRRSAASPPPAKEVTPIGL
jgi:hypothetical protein